jgi:6-phosphogluconolactonase (cycloisomerase 2 family)
LTLVLVALFASTSHVNAQSQSSPDSTAAATTIVAQYVYAWNASTDGTRGLIAGYRMASDGKLTSTGSPVSVAGMPRILIPSRLGAKLFGIGEHRLWSFGVNPTTGRLSFLAVVSFPSNVRGTALGINPQSTLLFAAKVINQGTSTEERRITTYRISPSGALTAIASTVVPQVEFDSQIVLDPAGKYMYVITLQPDVGGSKRAITQLQVNPTTGKVSIVRNFRVLPIPINLVRSPDGRFLYLGGSIPAVKVFSVDPTTGGLSEIQNVDCLCAQPGRPDFATFVAIDAPGKFLYQAAFGPDGIAVYSVNRTTGLLTPLPNAFFETGPQIAPDSTGKFLGLGEEGAVSTLSVGTDGVLTRVEGSSVPLPTDMRPLPFLRVLAVRQ